MDIKEYLDKFNLKLKEKKLNNFWVVVDRKDFKPLKGYSDTQIDKYIKDNKQYYINKKLANVIITVTKLQKNFIEKKHLVQVGIMIWEVDEYGLQSTGATLKILYNEDDLLKKKITLKEIQKFIKFCDDEVLLSDLINGIPYKNLLKKLNDKKIKF